MSNNTLAAFNRKLLTEAATVEGAVPPQTRIIAKHLLETGSITAVEASAVHRVRSLSRRISDLRDYGIEVTVEYKKDVTDQRYVRYSVQ